MGNAPRKAETPLAGEVPPSEAEEVNENYLDPRSPTPDVARTPISGKEGVVKHKITKNADLSKTLDEYQPDEKVISNNPILSAVIRNHLQLYDPRSPTHEFERTPIVLAPNGMRNNSNGVLNGSVSFETECDDKNAMDPDVVSESVYRELASDSTLDSTFSDAEPLGSSTASQEVIEKDALKISPKILLETNFDYVPRSEETDNTAVGIKTPTPVSLPDKIKSKLKSTEEDPRSPSQGIDRTPIVLPQKEIVEPIEEVEDMTEESLVAALQNGISDLRRTPAEPGNKNGILIYEDACTVLPNTPLTTQSATKNARTPLSCMKNKNEERAQSDAAFVDAKKKLVSRIPKRISHIPRLQKSMSLDMAKTKVEHENTPPVSARDVWDRDSSVVL